MKYYQAENTGKGFITHEDNEYRHISGYPGNIWVTENEIWAERVQAVEKTKVEAQEIVNTEVSSSIVSRQEYIDTLPDGEEKTRLQEELDQTQPPTLP